MTYKCRNCKHTMESEEAPFSCPACKRMFYDVFTKTGITSYAIMQRIDEEDLEEVPEAVQHMSDFADKMTRVLMGM